MTSPEREPGGNPMNHPEEPPTGTDGQPKFGRLLIVLACMVGIIVLITLGSEAYFTP